MCKQITNLENFDLIAIFQQKIIIDGEEENVCQEECCGGEEVPEIVIIKEVQVLTGPVQVPANKT